MSQETSRPQQIAQLPIKEEKKQARSGQISLEELLDSLKKVQEDVGQICELTSEEKRLVAAFFESFLKLMKPLASALPVSADALPEELGNVAQAYMAPTGHLILKHQDGKVELRDLSKETQRNLMIRVVKEVMPKFRQLTSAHRRDIEERITFLSLVTKEIQRISKAFSTATAE